MPTGEERDSFAMQAPKPVEFGGKRYHTEKEANDVEIQYLGQMLTATRIEDKQRLKSIADRLRFFATGRFLFEAEI